MDTKAAIAETIVKLCMWVNEKIENGATPDEIKIMPEVVKRIAELQHSIK